MRSRPKRHPRSASWRVALALPGHPVLGLALAGAAAGLLQRNHHLEHHIPGRLALIGAVVGHAHREVGQAVLVGALTLGAGEVDAPDCDLHLGVGARQRLEQRGPLQALGQRIRIGRRRQRRPSRPLRPAARPRRRCSMSTSSRRCAVISRCMRSTACCGSKPSS